jgi:hypothetical protein
MAMMAGGHGMVADSPVKFQSFILSFSQEGVFEIPPEILTGWLALIREVNKGRLKNQRNTPTV